MIELIENTDEEFVKLKTKNGEQLWIIVKPRILHECFECGIQINRGEKCFRPLTNGMNRMNRICRRCVDELRK